MNLTLEKAKQLLFNNLLYGENNRPAPIDLSFALTSIQPDYSKIWGIDISRWDGNVNLSVTKSLGASFVFIKGLDGTLRTRYFPENRQRALDTGLLHSPYVWLYPNNKVSCIAQAQEANKLLKEYPANLPIVVDFETTYYGGVLANPNFSDLKIWATEFLRLGNRKPILYSSKGYMNQFGTIPSDVKTLFEGLWIANYEVSSPNMPLGYAANEWDFWQFSSEGDAALIAPNDTNKLELDLNYAKSLARLQQLGGSIPDTTTQHTQPMVGVEQYAGTKMGWKYWLQIIDPTKVRYEVVNLSIRDNVSDIALLKGAKIATNGGDWDRITGEIKHPPFSPTILFRDNLVSINHDANPPEGIQHIFGVRYLIKDGVIQSYLSGTEPQYTEGHSRTIEGITSDGKHIQMISEGIYPNQGLTLRLAAEVMQQYGAVVAFDSGGGGDTTLFVNGQVLNKTEDIVNGVNVERAIPQILLIYPEGENMSYGTAKEKLGNTSTKRAEPSRYGATVGYVAPLSTIEFVDMVPVMVKGPADNPADLWLKLPDNTYVNYILNGVTYYTILTQPSTGTPSNHVVEVFVDDVSVFRMELPCE